MIKNFADSATKDIFDGTNSKAARAIPRTLWQIAKRKLDLLDAALDVKDLRVPPGNQLEALKGDLSGYFSIRVNQQYRIIFRFTGGEASDVKVTDYHD